MNIPNELRPLLERIEETAICDGVEACIDGDLFNELVALLAQPAAPADEAVEVVAWQDAENPSYTTGERRQMHGWATDGYPIRELMTVAQHQRIVASECLRVIQQGVDSRNKTICELREELELLHRQLDKFRSQSHGIPALAEQERLREQLAQRDAAIEEWSGTAVQNGMECDRLNEKLAGVVEALKVARELIAHGDFADGYCMCGMRIDTHDSGMQSGHAPCDAGDYYAGQVTEKIDSALAALEVGDE